jgi:magnesium transporter
MIFVWVPAERGLQRLEVAATAVPANAVWIDMHNVTRDDELAVESVLKVEIPTREELQGIEASSRLYREEKAVYMSATMLINSESDLPDSTVVTFIYTGDRLITLRYAEPWSFRIFAQRAARLPHLSAQDVLLGILEATIERLADMIERIASELNAFSQLTFRSRTANQSEPVDLQQVLFGIGKSGNVLSKVRESLVDKNRLIVFSERACKDWLTVQSRDRIRVLVEDIHSLADHASFTAGKISFLIDATLGLISIDQNRVIKIFSIAAVVLLPPTLVSTVYGMNFKHMPELEWWFGYPSAIALMVVSGVLPYWFFKRKGWL